MNVVLENNEQRTITNVFKSRREEKDSKEDLQLEITESRQVEDFARTLIPSNTDISRRIRPTLDDWGYNTQKCATNHHEILGKRIITSLWEDETASLQCGSWDRIVDASPN